MSDDDDLRFGARSIFGANTRRGLVEVALGSETIAVTPAKAREMAAFLVEAATSAEGDPFDSLRSLRASCLMRVLDRAGMSRQRAAQVLMAMRQERAVIERRARDEARRAIAEDQRDDDRPD